MSHLWFSLYLCPSSTTHRNLNDWTIQLGITRRRSHTYYGQKVKVARVIPHPQYSSTTTHDNDIALFQVSWRRGRPFKAIHSQDNSIEPTSS